MARILNKLNKKSVGIIFNFVLVFVLLISVTYIFINNGISLGWFGSNDRATANSLSVGVNNDSGFSILGYSIYRYDQYDNLQIDQNAIMRQYDSIFTDRNVHNSIVFKIDVEGLNVGDAFGIKVCSTPINEQDTQRYISDIVSLRASAMYIPPEDDVYSTVTSELENDIYPAKTFRTIDAQNVTTRTTDVTFDSLILPENGSVYVMMDYEPDLLGTVLVEFGTESDLSIEYTGNITRIEIFRSGG